MYFFDWRPGVSKWTARADIAFTQTAPPASGEASSGRNMSEVSAKRNALQHRLRPHVRQEVLRQLGLRDPHTDNTADSMHMTEKGYQQPPKTSILKKSIWCLSPRTMAKSRSA